MTLTVGRNRNFNFASKPKILTRKRTKKGADLPAQVFTLLRHQLDVARMTNFLRDTLKMILAGPMIYIMLMIKFF